MKTDTLLIKQDNGTFDIEWENGQIKFTEGLDTAIDLSFYGEKRASESEVARPERRRGWVGNELFDVIGFRGYEVGNKLWLLSQARITQRNLNLGISYIKNGLNWLIEDKLAKNVNVSGIIENNEKYKFTIEIVRFDNTVLKRQYNLWENTNFDGEI
jgi:phage gp46-like protein